MVLYIISKYKIINFFGVKIVKRWKVIENKNNPRSLSQSGAYSGEEVYSRNFSFSC